MAPRMEGELWRGTVHLPSMGGCGGRRTTGRSASARFLRRRLQRPPRPMSSSVGTAAQSMGYRLRHLQYEETLRGKPVVFTALINHTDIAMFGGLLVRYHSVQFPDLKRCSVSSVVDADSELCSSSCFGSHGSIKKREFQLEFPPANPMRLVPMDLCCVNRMICEAYCRDASQFSPASLAIDLSQSPAIANPGTYSNRLDRANGAPIG